MKKPFAIYIGFILFWGLCLFLALNRHSRAGIFNYHSEIWADKAGYYVYLPATFRYGFQADRFPDSMDVKTGNGFQLDLETGKVYTKYTYGVALMQLPFYLIAEFITAQTGGTVNGFSVINHRAINFASVTYLLLGLFLLFNFLKKQLGGLNAILALLSVFLATNLYYYAIDETGMSHIYSFFLFSTFIYYSHQSQFLSKSAIVGKLFFGLLTGLIVLIRPSNLIFLSYFFLIDTSGFHEIKQRLKNIFQFNSAVILALGAFIIILPQLIYWQYTHGNFVHYSYGNEGFNWLNPKLMQLWFSPNNGLFLYSPFYLLILIFAVQMIPESKRNNIVVMSIFIATSYVYASWWMWDFGCSFGSRNFVEYTALFSMPLARFYKQSSKYPLAGKIGLFLLVLLFIGYNLKMTYSYDGCFYGEGDWDWAYYFKLLLSPTK